MKRDASSFSRSSVIVVTLGSAAMVALAILAINSGRTPFVILGQLVLVTAWCLVLAWLWYVVQSRAKRDEQLRAQFKREVQTAREEGYSQGFRELARRLVSESDTFRNIDLLLTKYPDGGFDGGARIDTVECLLRDFRRYTGLESIRVGTVTEYDPRQHQTHEPLDPGERVVVVKPGWRLGTETVRMPVVRRY